MKVVPISSHLTDFGDPEPQDSLVPSTVAGGKETATMPSGEEMPPAGEQQPEFAQALDDAFEKGRRSGENEARKRHAAELEDLKAGFARQLEEERTRLGESLAERLALELRAGLTAVENAIAEATAAVLEPFVSETVKAMALKELVSLVHEILRDSQAVRITASGPRSLLEALREQLGETASMVDFREQDEPDIKIEVRDTLIVTRLQTWSAMLTGVEAT